MIQTASEVETDDGTIASELADREVTEEPAEETATETESEATLPLDQVFEILKNQRRRYVLSYLNEQDGPVSMSDLSEQIAAWENDKEVHELSSGERKRVYVGLYQCHLPKMDGMDIVEFNKPRGIIELGANAELFDKYLEEDESTGRPWHRYYAAICLGSWLALPVAALLGGAVSLPVMEVTLVAVLSVFSACAVVHVRAEREADEREDAAATAA